MNTWLITGVAGFVGSTILEELLKSGQTVIGLDNLSNGKTSNLLEVKDQVGNTAWANFSFVQGDIRNKLLCNEITSNVDYVIHQAALASVQDSIKNPTLYIDVNVNGFINIMEAAKLANVKKVVYASSCAAEDPISPYGLSKLMNELYASMQKDIKCVGLRYYNIYGPRQNMSGQYSAVIPKWINLMVNHNPVTIYGTGESTRDFIHVKDIATNNIKSAQDDSTGILKLGTTIPTSLIQLFNIIKKVSGSNSIVLGEPFKEGDKIHSCSTDSISCSISLEDGLTELVDRYKKYETKNISN
jgi:UDP-N-acetylglucosamine 4-epimerase